MNLSVITENEALKCVQETRPSLPWLPLHAALAVYSPAYVHDLEPVFFLLPVCSVGGGVAGVFQSQKLLAPCWLLHAESLTDPW